jgi:site-specific recombinase XerD
VRIPELLGRQWSDAVRPHDLRHSCASFLLAAGASPRTVLKPLGHSQIALTMNTYTQVLPGIERTAVESAAETIFGEGSADTNRVP